MIELIHYDGQSGNERIKAILDRQATADQATIEQVSQIIAEVRRDGDEALFRYTELFDGIQMAEANLRIDPELIERLAAQVPDSLVNVLRQAIANIKNFHEHQREQSWQITDDDGTTLGQRVSPIASVGLYVPGGKAAYPSSVMMNAVPAQVAGVKRIVVVTPPGTFMQAPIIAAALRELGLTEVYGVGGAQAIAALAYGTQTIPRVDKIVGPGNLFVATAKRMVFGAAGIDSFAGPSEIVVLADDSAKPNYVAADLLSQAEHDERASAICITTSPEFAATLQTQLENQLETLPRAAIASASLRDFGAIIVVADIPTACKLINELAPEHLELMIESPHSVVDLIENAGAIFIGPYSSEPVGDYFAGPNHVLPTAGTARFGSALGVYDFLKRTSIIEYSRRSLRRNGHSIELLASAEGLDAHTRAITVRLADEDGAGNTAELNGKE